MSVLGNDVKRKRSMQALERATGHLQARVGREVTLRRTPRLRFAYDETFDKGRRIEQLLAEHEPMPDYIPDPDGGARATSRRGRHVSRAEVLDGAARRRGRCACARTPRPTATRSARCSASAARWPRPAATSCSTRTATSPSRASSRSSASSGSSAACPRMRRERTLIALDCGSAQRIDRAGEVAGQFARVVNIDHHHDNTLFGAVNLVDAEASCTAEIVAGLLDEAGIPLAEGAALALYVGPRDRHGPLPVREHDAARAPSSRRGCWRQGVRARARVLDALRVAARWRASGCSGWRSGARRSPAAVASP